MQWEIFRTIFLDGAERAAAVRRRRSEAVDLRLPRRRREHLRRRLPRHRARRRAARAGAELPLDGRGHRRVQRDPRSGRATTPFFSSGRSATTHPVSYGGKDSEPVDRSRPLTARCASKADSEETAADARRAGERLAARDRDGDRRRCSPVASAPDARGRSSCSRAPGRESQSVADALAARGVPAVLTAQEGLYETDEARHVRDLLRAIADPHDPAQAPARLADAVLRAVAGRAAGGRGRRRSAAGRSPARLARRRAERRPERAVRAHPRRQRPRPARAVRGRQPCAGSPTSSSCSSCCRRCRARRHRPVGDVARRLGRAGRAAGRPRRRRGQHACASRATATPSRS